LNRVIETRLGIPISLSILYIILGQKLGLPLAGAGLPGHFMVLVEWERQPFFLDPFHEGRALTAGQCREFLMSLGYPFHERYLTPCPTRDILARVIHNLISIYHQSGRPKEAQALTDIVEVLSSVPSRDNAGRMIQPPSA
jgi:regulator of sirC expression with transglutaminase-like and TPR domain